MQINANHTHLQNRAGDGVHKARSGARRPVYVGLNLSFGLQNLALEIDMHSPSQIVTWYICTN